MPEDTNPPKPEEPVPYRKNLHAVALGHLGGMKGGKARASSLSPYARSAIARHAANARWAKYRENKKGEIKWGS